MQVPHRPGLLIAAAGAGQLRSGHDRRGVVDRFEALSEPVHALQVAVLACLDVLDQRFALLDPWRVLPGQGGQLLDPVLLGADCCFELPDLILK